MASKSRTSTGAKGKASAAALLGAIGEKDSAKTASKTPEVIVTDDTQLRQIAAIVIAKNEKKQAESALDIAQGAFRNTACDLFEARCRRDGTLYSSIKLLGKPKKGNPLRLSYTQPRDTTKMKENERSSPLHSIFGDKFDNLFEPKRTIEIDTTVLDNDQTVAAVEALQTALDPTHAERVEALKKKAKKAAASGDTAKAYKLLQQAMEVPAEDDTVFDAAVAVESLIRAQEAFYTGRVLDENVRKLAERAHDDGHCKMKAASFKV